MEKKYKIRFLLAFGIALTICVIFYESVLTSISHSLVHEDPLFRADAIVILVGSSTGNRIKAAAKLYNNGFGDKLVFSGFEVYPGTYTSTLMKTYALNLGIPEDKIIVSNTDEEVSTRGESIANLKLLYEHNLKSFILVTSAFHTRRAQLIYEKTISLTGSDVKFSTYPAPDPLIPIQDWWMLRTGQKGIFFELVKSIAFYF
jgi:uncharacterized SAM-binding protein YcdF (DUF218 family)